MPTAPEPLPDSHPAGWNGELARAYSICCRLQDATGSDSPPPPLCARLLGYLLLHAPTDSGRTFLAREIMSCANETALIELGKHYIDHFIKCFRVNSGPTPQPSDAPSRPSEDHIADEISFLLHDQCGSYSVAKRKALVRDQYRCMVTREYDKGYLYVHPCIYADLETAGKLDGAVYTMGTHATHIFPCKIVAAAGDPIEPDQPADYRSQCWATVQNLSGVDFVTDRLGGNGIHQLHSLLTLNLSTRFAFDELRLWFTPAPDPAHPLGDMSKARYRVHIHSSIQGTVDVAYVPDFVEWTTDDPTNFPLPDPRFIALHATCAVVAHLSGAAEYVERVLEGGRDDAEAEGVLAQDGSMAEYLSYRLIRGLVR